MKSYLAVPIFMVLTAIVFAPMTFGQVYPSPKALHLWEEIWTLVGVSVAAGIVMAIFISIVKAIKAMVRATVLGVIREENSRER